MAKALEEVRNILGRLPKDATFEDIQYHIYVPGKIERGLKGVQEGRTLSQKQVERRVLKWLDRWTGSLNIALARHLTTHGSGRHWLRRLDPS